MKTTHTPGPWYISMQPGPIIYGAKGAQVADLRGERKTLVVELDEAVANTRLIAAAPELLAALERCVHYLADLNGSEWIKGTDAGSVDMRQRAKSLQGYAFNMTVKAKG